MTPVPCTRGMVLKGMRRNGDPMMPLTVTRSSHLIAPPAFMLNASTTSFSHKRCQPPILATSPLLLTSTLSPFMIHTCSQRIPLQLPVLPPLQRRAVVLLEAVAFHFNLPLPTYPMPIGLLVSKPGSSFVKHPHSAYLPPNRNRDLRTRGKSTTSLNYGSKRYSFADLRTATTPKAAWVQSGLMRSPVRSLGR